MPIMDFLFWPIIFYLRNMTPCFIDDINPLITKRKSSTFFMTIGKILIDVESNMGCLCKMNRRIVFKLEAKNMYMVSIMSLAKNVLRFRTNFKS